MNNASVRDFPDDAIASPDNGSYGNVCCACKQPFTGHKRRVLCKVCADADEAKSKERALWLSTHKAPADWVILTLGEVGEIGREVANLSQSLTNERAVRRQLGGALSNLLFNRGPYQFSRAKEALEAAKALDLQ